MKLGPARHFAIVAQDPRVVSKDHITPYDQPHDSGRNTVRLQQRPDKNARIENDPGEGVLRLSFMVSLPNGLYLDLDIIVCEVIRTRFNGCVLDGF